MMIIFFRIHFNEPIEFEKLLQLLSIGHTYMRGGGRNHCEAQAAAKSSKFEDEER